MFLSYCSIFQDSRVCKYLGKKEDKRKAIDIVKLNAEIKETVTREQVLKDRIIAEIEGKKMAKEKSIIRSSAAEYLIYVASTGETQESIEIRYEDENIWLTQRMMATLYGVDVRTVNDHIKKIYSDCELSEDATIRKFRIVQTEGSRQVSRDVIHYNLQMIIVVDFKVNNERAVQFRKWANGIVKDFTIKGWVMVDERLKNGGTILQKIISRNFLIRFVR